MRNRLQRPIHCGPRSRYPQGLSNYAFRSLLLTVFILISSAFAGQVCAQTPNRIARTFDPNQVQKLENHYPAWAVPANDSGALPADRQLDNLTLVLARSPAQEQAFEQFLNDQQDPSSPEFRHWLTPGEIGERFGVSQGDLATVTGWLQSEHLHVNWVAPSGVLVGFGGAAADVGRAFQTEFHAYTVNGIQRISVASDPMIPVALAPVIRSARGFFSIDEEPNHSAQAMLSSASSPAITVTGSGGTYHYLTPADFATIYDVPSSVTGAGYTVGIVGRARTNMADFTNFKSITGSTFANPTEVVPTALGGVDPGPAYTAPPSCETTNSCSSALTGYLDDQSEATLDVFRAGSTAPGASILLVTATNASGSIGVDTEYLVNTTPVPAQVISISFGACELVGGPSGVNFWDTLFQQAAGEGISVFVASGDSGASECDTYFATPPASPQPNSPNYICSSGFATCVGGTEFNDTSNPSQYWSSTNLSNYRSALSYIPEGAWNEPLNSSGGTEAAATGGGVSLYIATPIWQTGTGVPSPGTGRYTPDVSFSASGHDGYFSCFAAGGGSCVSGSNGTSFEVFAGTSAAAPGMAGVAALLDQSKGAAQGNLNPGIYSTAVSAPAAFHDVTVSSSGVSGCSVTTPSLCNNSIPGPTGLTGGQAGYLVQTGYDEATGWGSLDVAQFVNSYAVVQKTTPTVSVTPIPASITTAQAYQLQIAVSGGSGNPVPTGSVTAAFGTTTLGVLQLTGGTVTSNFAAGTLPAGIDTITVTYAPDSASSSTYNGASGSTTINVASLSKTTPTITWATPAAITYGTALGATQLDATASVPGTFVYLPAAGAILTAGQQTLSANFTPTDTANYNTVAASVTLTVSKATPTITWATPAAVVVGTVLSATQLDATASVPGTFVYNPPAGTVMSTAGNVTLSVTFTPTDTTDYNNATDSVVLVVSTVPPGFNLNGTSVSVTPGASSGNTSTITVTPTGGFTGAVTLSASVTSSPSGAIDPPTISFGSTSPISITGAGAGTATLTISTTAATSSRLEGLPRPGNLLFPAGSVLACVVLLWIPARWRRGRNLLGVIVLLIACAWGMVACGGGNGGGGGGGNTGTTAGTYTITITGTSGSVSATPATINLTVL